jgi:hypothetical protein
MLKENEGQEQNCVGLTVQREARCTNDLLGFSDSSLLFLAAKAIDGKYDLLTGCVTFDNGFTYVEFDPINYEAHAMRLLIRLELQIHFVEDSDCFWIDVSLPAHSNYELEQDCRVIDTVARKNVDACTRKAIVLAAAQIGRART